MAAASQYIRVAAAGRHCRLRLQAVVVLFFFQGRDKGGCNWSFFVGVGVNTNMVSTDGISHQSCKRTCDTSLQQVLGGSETHGRRICC